MKLAAVELLTTHPLINDRVRLAIMATLAASKSAIEFKVLLKALNLTKGNLSAHMKKLEEAKFVKVKKEFINRKPRTTYECTQDGRKVLNNYLQQMQKLLEQTQ